MIWISRVMALVSLAAMSIDFRDAARAVSWSGAIVNVAIAAVNFGALAMNIYAAGMPCGMRRFRFDPANVSLYPGEQAESLIGPLGAIWIVSPAPGRAAFRARVAWRLRRFCGLDAGKQADIKINIRPEAEPFSLPDEGERDDRPGGTIH